MFYNITDSLAITVSYYIVLINIRTVILYHLMFNIKKYISSATTQKLNWLKAQWVNETCRNLQAKVIKTAAFCHNRALQDLYPASYRLLFTTGSFTLTASPLSNEPGVQRVQRTRMEG